MENNNFKTVAFGGFDKQDVVRYIEQTAAETAEVTEKLQQENDRLRRENTALQDELDTLRPQAQELRAANTRLVDERDRQSTEGQRQNNVLQTMVPQVAALTKELEVLRPQAEAYAQVKEHIGSIECDARKRADELENATTARLQGLLTAYQKQYAELVSTFEVASAHVTGELRKVEVNLSQLPCTFDKTGAELAELEEVLRNNRT
ncbi:MAG: hypothetical protein RRY95_05535 [Oscillospiraceae bacterium]